MSDHEHVFVPRGWYLAREAGQLAGVSGDRIGQWARRGYIRSSRSTGVPRVYSFQDVAEALVVHELLDSGVPSREIRRAILNLRNEYGDWPLTTAPIETSRLETDAKARLVSRSGDMRLDIGKGAGMQGVMVEYTDLKDVVDLLRRGGWVMRRLPNVQHIEVDPDRLSGRPTIRNRRIPADKVALIAQRRGGHEVLRNDYDLTKREVEDATRWFDAVSEYELAA